MDQDRMRKQSDTTRHSSMDPADGSREDMRGSGRSSERMKGSSSDSGGISNRERSREECEQDQLPERGKSKSER